MAILGGILGPIANNSRQELNFELPPNAGPRIFETIVKRTVQDAFLPLGPKPSKLMVISARRVAVKALQLVVQSETLAVFRRLPRLSRVGDNWRCADP